MTSYTVPIKCDIKVEPARVGDNTNKKESWMRVTFSGTLLGFMMKQSNGKFAVRRYGARYCANQELETQDQALSLLLHMSASWHETWVIQGKFEKDHRPNGDDPTPLAESDLVRLAELVAISMEEDEDVQFCRDLIKVLRSQGVEVDEEQPSQATPTDTVRLKDGRVLYWDGVVVGIEAAHE